MNFFFKKKTNKKQKAWQLADWPRPSCHQSTSTQKAVVAQHGVAAVAVIHGPLPSFLKT